MSQSIPATLIPGDGIGPESWMRRSPRCELWARHFNRHVYAAPTVSPSTTIIAASTKSRTPSPIHTSRSSSKLQQDHHLHIQQNSPRVPTTGQRQHHHHISPQVRLVQPFDEPRLPLGQARRMQLRGSDLRQPLRRRGWQNLEPDLGRAAASPITTDPASLDTPPGQPGGVFSRFSQSL